MKFLWGIAVALFTLVLVLVDAIKMLERRDSDRSGEAIETPKSGSTEGESAGRSDSEGIAQTPDPHPNQDSPNV